MTDRSIRRLRDIIDAVDQIELLLEGKSLDDIKNDRFARAAFERFLEVLSEASRHLPDDLKRRAPEIPWRRIADIGNHLRHAYHRVDAEILWNVYAGHELTQLRSGAISLLTSLER